jgi:hypothetical protein
MNDEDLIGPQGPQPFWALCLQCNTRYEFLVDPEGFYKWRNQGVHIQYALPDNTPDERELILNHICGTCFDKMCPPDDGE